VVFFVFRFIIELASMSGN